MQQQTSYFNPPFTKNGAPYKQPDELDLFELIRKGISFIKTFRVILLSSVAAGFCLGLYLYLSSPKQYSTRLILRPWFLNQAGLLSNEEEIQVIEDWKTLLSKGEKNQLATALNCDLETINHIKSISAEEILRTYEPNNPNGFLVNVSVTDTSFLQRIQDGLIYGLNNTPYTKRKIETRQRRDSVLINELRKEVTKLDVTRNSIDSVLKTNNARPGALLVDISRVNAESIDLNEKMLGYEEELRFLSAVQVLENFSRGALTRQGLAKFTLLGLALGAFVGYILSLLVYTSRRVGLNGHFHPS